MVSRNPTNEFIDAYRSFIQLLNEYHVEYLVVGGFAVIIYGHQRSTNDLDILIHCTEANANKLIQVCTFYGIDKENLSLNMFLSEKENVSIGDTPFRIHLLKLIGGLSFEEAYLKRKEISWNGLFIKLIDIDDLITSKVKSGRHKDYDDILHLNEIKKQKND